MGPGQESIELVTGGRGWLADDGGWREVVPGDLLWHANGQSTIARRDPQDPYRCLGVRLTVSGGQRPVPRCSRWDDLPAVHAFVQEVMRLHVDSAVPPAALLAWVVGTLWLRASRGGGPAHPPRIRQVLDLMAADPVRAPDIATLAAQVGWSAGRLHRAFKSAVGVSPHQHRIALRLRLARELMTSTDSSLADIAQRCGFASPGHLSRAFRSGHGETPQQWRRKQSWLG